MPTFNAIVLSGGGTRGVQQLGALHALQHSWRDTYRVIVGSSVGAVVGLLVLLGYEPLEIKSRFLTPELLSHFSRENVSWNNLKSGSLFTWDMLDTTLRWACENRLDYIPTLSELSEEAGGRRLVVTTYNLTKQRTEFLSSDTHPDMCVLQALRMTTAIPMVFPKLIYNRCHYVDGSVGQHTPWRYLIKGHDLGIEDEDLRALVIELPSPLVEVNGASTSSTTAAAESTALSGWAASVFQLLLSSVYTNQDDNELLAMSVLHPARTCWVNIEGCPARPEDPFSLMVKDGLEDEMWKSGEDVAKLAQLNFLNGE